MVWIDWCIVVILAVSVVFGVLRGFVKEALGLAAWVIGFWVALAHWQMLASKLGRYIDSGSSSAVAAFAVLLFGTLLIGAVINHFIAKGLEKAGLQALDRALGGLFGLVRGVAIAAVMLLFAGLLHADRSEAWRKSKLLPYFGPTVAWLRSHLDDHPDFGRSILGRNG